MQYLLILICMALFALIGWHATMVGTDREQALGAPQIEMIVDAGARDVITGYAKHPMTVITSGRNVTVTGTLDNETDLDEMLDALRDVYLLVRVDADVNVLPSVDAYTLAIEKRAVGEIDVVGFAPSEAEKARISGVVQAMRADAPVSVNLTVAAGAPDGDWTGMVVSGLEALGHLDRGSLRVSGPQATLSGTSESVDAIQAARNSIRAAPMGEWTERLDAKLALASPYRLLVVRNADGSVLISGNAPDAEVEARFRGAAEKISSQPVSGTLDLADGVPDDGWPDRALAAIDVLGSTESGQVSISDESILLRAAVADDDALALLLPRLDDGWQHDITVNNPTPDARLDIAIDQEGSTRLSGMVGDAALRELLATRFPGADRDIDTETPVRPVALAPVLDAFDIVLLRFDRVNVRIEGSTVALEGTLHPGFSTSGVEAALRSALDERWLVSVVAVETAPAAEVILGKQDGVVSVSGLLPEGLTSDSVSELIGDASKRDGLSSGGDGSVEAWRLALAASSQAFRYMDRATGNVSGSLISLDGLMLPGYDSAVIETFAAKDLPEGWSMNLAATTIEPNEGDRRQLPTSDDVEEYRRGYWLPLMNFPVSMQRCGSEIDNALDGATITFVTGSAEIDPDGRLLLNRLAAISMRCLNSSTLSVEIGGHTDSTGNQDANDRLSQARADAVFEALVGRGVRPSALTAVGYGSAVPIAANDSDAGRAKNRRITFNWSDGDG